MHQGNRSPHVIETLFVRIGERHTRQLRRRNRHVVRRRVVVLAERERRVGGQVLVVGMEIDDGTKFTEQVPSDVLGHGDVIDVSARIRLSQG